MRRTHIIPCGGVPACDAPEIEGNVLPLRLASKRRGKADVTLKVEDLHERLLKPVPPEYVDLLEIAAYVYCADQATARGGRDPNTFGERWRRKFSFRIPVRVPDFWSQAGVHGCLRETLEFLSDDEFNFEFVQAQNPSPMQEYFPDLLPEGPENAVERVVLFSGGLDSLAGAVEECVVHKRRVMLVTHKPTEKLNRVHQRLQAALAEKAGKFRPMHLHVRVHKDSELNKNYTQRTRSFLYASMGAAVAKMLGLDELRFYENGVVSMNLPACAQVVGSKATRTTHPRVLNGFQKLFSEVAGADFRVINDFVLETKGDVIRRIEKHGCGDLISASLSCAHVYGFSHEHPHCGVCSQCIDRRIAVVAVGADHLDPADKYKTDVFTGERPKDEDRMMVATYIERANRMSKLRDAADLLTLHPEVARVISSMAGSPLAAAEKVFTLHKRHASEVNIAIERMIAQHARALRERSLPRDCLLRLTYDSGGGTPPSPPAQAQFIKQQDHRWEKEDPGPNVYRLWKGHKVWNLVFGGKTESLADERAIKLVEYLLKNPPEEAIHASELEARVDGSPLLERAGAIDLNDWRGGDVSEVAVGLQEASGNKLSGGMGTLLKEALAEQRSIRDDESLPDDEREAASAKIQELLGAYERGGKSKGGGGKAVDRVRKAVKALVRELMSAESTRSKPNPVLRDFGRHLEQHLWLPSMGGRGRAGASGKPGCFTYEPPPGVIWRD